MLDVFSLLSDISPAIKISWVVFAAWSAAQVVWYQRARTAAAVPARAVRKRKGQSAPRRPVAGTPSSQPADSEKSAELLTSLGFQSPGASRYGVPMSSGQMGPTTIS